MLATSAQYQTTADSDRLLDREALVMQHLPQVLCIAKRIHRRIPQHVSLDDLISTGVVGLLAAVDKYDPAVNVQLATYAEKRIRGAIIDSLRDLDWAPRGARKKPKLIESAIHRIHVRTGREPLEEEIAAELGISQEEYQEWLTLIQGLNMVRLEYVSSDNQTGDHLRFIPDDSEDWPSNVFERKELERILTTAIERMSKLERSILHLYYYEDLCLREIAEVVGLHLSRVGQLRVQAVLRLRSHIKRVWTLQSRKQS